jgi:haloalkane dehalogenase
MTKIIRTPENRFDNLEDYNFSSNYIDVDENLRLHYLDEGDKTNLLFYFFTVSLLGPTSIEK